MPPVKRSTQEELSFPSTGVVYLCLMPADVAGNVSQLNQPLPPIGKWESLFWDATLKLTFTRR